MSVDCALGTLSCVEFVIAKKQHAANSMRRQRTWYARYVEPVSIHCGRSCEVVMTCNPEQHLT